MQINRAKKLLEEHSVSDNIVKHVTKVAQICQFIADNNPKADKNALICAALLHDLFKNTDDHSKEIFNFLNKLGEPKIALITYKHDFFSIIDPQKQPFALEEKILSYADKRVKFDQIVSLQERFDDLKQRYNHDEEDSDKVKKTHHAYFDLEKELFEPLNISPNDIKEENLKDL